MYSFTVTSKVFQIFTYFRQEGPNEQYCNTVKDLLLPNTVSQKDEKPHTEGLDDTAIPHIKIQITEIPLERKAQYRNTVNPHIPSYFICERISSCSNKEGGQPVRFNQYLQFYLVNLKFRQVVSIYIVNRFESPYNIELIQLPSLIRLTQYRSKKHHFNLFTGSDSFFFFFFFFLALYK